MTRAAVVAALTIALLLHTVDAAHAQSQNDISSELAAVEQRIADHPHDPELRFRRAQLLGYLGDDDPALAALDDLRERYPRNVDYALARARLLSRMGRDREALAELEAATELAPGYEAVWELRFALLARASADPQLDALRDEAAVRFPTADWWRAPLQQSRPGWTVSIGTQFDSLSNGLPDWNNQTIDIARSDERIGTLSAWLWRNQRGPDREDFAVGIGGETRWREVWFGGADLTLADGPDFLAESAFSAHVGRSFDHGWVADLRYWRRDFTQDSVDTMIAMLERYVGGFRIAYSLSLSQLNGGSTAAGHVAAVNWYYGDSSNIGLSLTSGQEVESIGAGQVLETDVSGATISGRHDVNERVALQWWLGTHDQGDIYRRRFVGMAVALRL